MLLKKELIGIAAKILTDSGVGKHDYLGLLYNNAEYITFFHNDVIFIQPMHPGTYLANAPMDEGDQCQAAADHKAELEMYYKYLGVNSGLKQLVLNAVEKSWLTKLEDKYLVF